MFQANFQFLVTVRVVGFLTKFGFRLLWITTAVTLGCVRVSHTESRFLTALTFRLFDR